MDQLISHCVESNDVARYARYFEAATHAYANIPSRLGVSLAMQAEGAAQTWMRLEEARPFITPAMRASVEACLCEMLLQPGMSLEHRHAIRLGMQDAVSAVYEAHRRGWLLPDPVTRRVASPEEVFLRMFSEIMAPRIMPERIGSTPRQWQADLAHSTKAMAKSHVQLGA